MTSEDDKIGKNKEELKEEKKDDAAVTATETGRQGSIS
jgi:hypothetical protein